MKISIIIPVYNSGSTIKRCVDSILDSENTDCEIILVDDGSSDDSPSICEKMASENHKILFIKTAGEGVSAARNTGLSAATGDLIGFCDSDDTYEADSIEKILSFFESNPDKDILVTGYNRVEGSKIISYKYEIDQTWSSRKLLHHIVYDDTVMGAVWNKFFKKELLVKSKFKIGLTHCEDMHFVAGVLSKNVHASVYVADFISYNYFANPTGVTNSVSRLFDSRGEFRYRTSLNDIITDFSTDVYTTMLIRHKLFFIATDTMKHFELDSNQKESIKKVIKENFGSFVMLTWRFPKKNTKRFGALIKQINK